MFSRLNPSLLARLCQPPIKANLTHRVFITPQARKSPLLAFSTVRAFTQTRYAMAQEFRLKSPSTIADLKELDKVEAEVDGVEGGKVLLVKVDGKVSAVNANCTHYGAPLKNGVLAPDGRLTCPWHGGELTPSSVGSG